jgi:hypothetical protein
MTARALPMGRRSPCDEGLHGPRQVATRFPACPAPHTGIRSVSVHRHSPTGAPVTAIPRITPGVSTTTLALAKFQFRVNNRWLGGAHGEGELIHCHAQQGTHLGRAYLHVAGGARLGQARGLRRRRPTCPCEVWAVWFGVDGVMQRTRRDACGCKPPPQPRQWTQGAVECPNSSSIAALRTGRWTSTISQTWSRRRSR